VSQSLIEENEQINAQVDSSTDPYRNFAIEDVSDLPKELSWIKYLGPVREQKDCGSCYAISTMSMLSARLRMKGHDITLSPQQSIDCNYYNQGCDGGYPFLVEKFGTENHLVTEATYPYTAYT
jgi:cathepsin C